MRAWLALHGVAFELKSPQITLNRFAQIMKRVPMESKPLQTPQTLSHFMITHSFFFIQCLGMIHNFTFRCSAAEIFAAKGSIGEGKILLLTDPIGAFKRPSSRRLAKEEEKEENSVMVEKAEEGVPTNDKGCETTPAATMIKPTTSLEATMTTVSANDKDDGVAREKTISLLQHVPYKSSSIVGNSFMAAKKDFGSSAQQQQQQIKRGDLVCFNYKKGTVKDLRLLEQQKAVLVKAVLSKINAGVGILTHDNSTTTIHMSEIVGCEIGQLTEGTEVEFVSYQNQAFGVARIKDLYLAKPRTSRLKLNLKVKKQMGGVVQSQSKMARGPDGTYGFAPGWTTRQSEYTFGSLEGSGEKIGKEAGEEIVEGEANRDISKEGDTIEGVEVAVVELSV